MLLTLMIRPERCFIMISAAIRQNRNTPSRLVPNTVRQSSSDIRTNRPSRITPALFTRMSSFPPHSFCTRSIQSFAVFGAAASPCIDRAIPPDCITSATSALAASRLPRYTNATLAPSAANDLTIARPMPRLPPVTSAILSLSSIGGPANLPCHEQMQCPPVAPEPVVAVAEGRVSVCQVVTEKGELRRDRLHAVAFTLSFD